VPSRLSLICHPFHNGLKGVDMGAGPLRLLDDPDLVGGLDAQGWDVSTVAVEPPDERDPEIVRIAETDRRLATVVRAAVADSAFPLVLAGNCNSCLGTVAGLDPAAGSLGVVWFDAHGDFDTPDRSLGFFDGMGLAILTGNGWELLRGTIDGFTPIEERAVVLAGVRDLAEHQERPLEYLHVDLDVLDPSEGPANRFASDGGLYLDELTAAIELVFDRFPVGAAAITAYDPALDADGRMARAASHVIQTVTRRALEQQGRSAR
jgi:arginase